MKKTNAKLDSSKALFYNLAQITYQIAQVGLGVG